MVFKTLTGRTKNVRNAKSKIINWEGSSLSKFQQRTKIFLKPYWKNDWVFEEFPVVGTRMSIDILNLTRKVAVECQGEQHYKYNKHFHQNKANWIEQMRRDSDKLKFCEINDITLVEIFPDDVLSVDLFANFGITLL